MRREAAIGGSSGELMEFSAVDFEITGHALGGRWRDHVADVRVNQKSPDPPPQAHRCDSYRAKRQNLPALRRVVRRKPAFAPGCFLIMTSQSLSAPWTRFLPSPDFIIARALVDVLPFALGRWRLLTLPFALPAHAAVFAAVPRNRSRPPLLMPYTFLSWPA
jgi:hypothetical protein